MTLYTIAHWADLFETAETRKLDSLRWVPTRNRHDGLGFRRMVKEQDRCDLFSAWNLMLQVASKGTAPQRGKLIRDGVPLTAEDLADMTGFPEPVFTRALSFFSSQRIGWLVKSEVPSTQDTPDRSGTNPGQTGTNPGQSGSNPLEGMEGMEGREGTEAPQGNGAGTLQELHFEPVKRGLFPKEYQAMEAAADREIVRLTKDPANYTHSLTTEAQDLVTKLEHEGKADRAQAVRARKDCLVKSLTQQAQGAIDAWTHRKVEIRAAMNGVKT